MANTKIMSNWLETGRFKETMCDQQGKLETLEDSAAPPAAQVDPQDELAAAFVSSTPGH